MSEKKENRLKGEKSPYLLQHAGNPVDWYPWSTEALDRAGKEGKPLLISIGYSSCHWCHVMERESFEDAATAELMNERFISIKIDREERPDLDSLYMKAVQSMTSQAGWPLTVFATPEGVPFYGGSYFPPSDTGQMPSFKSVLLAVSKAFTENKEQVKEMTAGIERSLNAARLVAGVEPTTELADTAFETARFFFDPINGGFGGGVKFPHAMFLSFLLRFYRRTKRADALTMVTGTLESMAGGGIYDHLGGGFHRYSVDLAWEVPHFEKMLYDNALLARLYAEAYEITGEALFKDVAEECFAYILGRLRSPEGGFYSAEDADVDGIEGDFYLWDYKELEAVLGTSAGRFAAFYSMTPEGNYEGLNVVRIARAGQLPDGGAPTVPDDIKTLRQRLFEAREKRTHPDIDTKIIAGWNGLAISAMASAARTLGRKDLAQEAEKTASFLLGSLKDDSGRLLRYYLDGRSHVRANLEDYALVADALFCLHEATGEARWLAEAFTLVEDMVRLFHDLDTGLFFDTGIDQDSPFLRERDMHDNDVPSGSSVAASVLVKASVASGKAAYMGLAEGILRSVGRLNEDPLSYGNFLCVMESMFLAGYKEGRDTGEVGHPRKRIE
ncbi:MAG: thioredoxin domain-containing protein [Deltaproteobacteria bacterium]